MRNDHIGGMSITEGVVFSQESGLEFVNELLFQIPLDPRTRIGSEGN